MDQKVVSDLVQWLRTQDCNLYMDRNTAELIGETAPCSQEEIPTRSDLLIVLGGDGTMLNVAHIGSQPRKPGFLDRNHPGRPLSNPAKRFDR